MTDDTLKSEVSRIAETIFRRVEYDGSLHKSSLEDELYRWAREMLQSTIAAAPAQKSEDVAWAKATKKEFDYFQGALAAQDAYWKQHGSTGITTGIDDNPLRGEPPTHTHSITTTVTPTCTIRRNEFEVLVKAGHIDVSCMKLSKLSDAPPGYYRGRDEMAKYRLID